MILPRDKKLRQHSTELRTTATPEEMHLWYDFLRNYPIQFNRQRIIGEYTADFYCARAKLVIELDGSQHYKKNVMEYDAERTAYFRAMELEVLRFSNVDIRDTFCDVCAIIDQSVKARTPKAPRQRGSARRAVGIVLAGRRRRRLERQFSVNPAAAWGDNPPSRRKRRATRQLNSRVCRYRAQHSFSQAISASLHLPQAALSSDVLAKGG